MHWRFQDSWFSGVCKQFPSVYFKARQHRWPVSFYLNDLSLRPSVRHNYAISGHKKAQTLINLISKYTKTLCNSFSLFFKKVINIHPQDVDELTTCLMCTTSGAIWLLFLSDEVEVISRKIFFGKYSYNMNNWMNHHDCF